MDAFIYILVGLLFFGAGVAMFLSKHAPHIFTIPNVSEATSSTLGKIWLTFVVIGLAFLLAGGRGAYTAFFPPEISIEGATGNFFRNARKQGDPKDGISIKNERYCFRTPERHDIICFEEALKAADADQNQVVSKDEWRLYLRNTVDRNGDGMVANFHDRLEDN